eukprot:TRINITY_DN6368_c0_g2_i3.p1 TRINITY_DN6368_c0_g2~~TRINITY_DN6368_c0_g2_i3.p1  ORF type:complete len:173 (-),score=20.99 TRINITY_DN6368_c0_g2_i3:49-567(-)
MEKEISTGGCIDMLGGRESGKMLHTRQHRFPSMMPKYSSHQERIMVAVAFLAFFGSIELFYISASLTKVHEGGWIPLPLSLIFMCIVYVWNYGTLKNHDFDVENRVSIYRIFNSGPCIGMVRVPVIEVIYTDIVIGVPAVFGHFVTNLPAFHQVLVFVCVKSIQVPYVCEHE